MTPDQFSALVSLSRMTDVHVRAARLVLVNGMSQSAAARAVGAPRQRVHEAVRRLRQADDVIRQAYQSG